jgi:hypothetical protein
MGNTRWSFDATFGLDKLPGDEASGAARQNTFDLAASDCANPQSAARVTKALDAFESSAAALADMATRFIEAHGSEIVHCVDMCDDVKDDIRHMMALVDVRRRTREALSRSAREAAHDLIAKRSSDGVSI